MKIFLITTVVAAFVLIMQPAFAQSNVINHTLKQGESLSALAKQYNTNVGDIMRLNNMHADTKLVYGSVIKVPSKNIQTETKNTEPVTEILTNATESQTKHTVTQGETLYSISKEYNISIDDLKAWNNLTDNSVKIGSVLIVANSNTSVNNSQPVAEIKRKRVETIQENATLTAVEPEQKIEQVNNVVDEKPVNADSNTNNQVIDVTSDNIEPTSSVTKNTDGYFEDSYIKTRRQQHVSGTSKTFKTASGWNDGKYYILANDINPGTIVKLTADNGHSVYAKVLWNMGDLKENSGINFRVSDATAAALNENSSLFNLDIYY